MCIPSADPATVGTFTVRSIHSVVCGNSALCVNVTVEDMLPDGELEFVRDPEPAACDSIIEVLTTTASV